MLLHKVCRSIDVQGAEWKSYCRWRGRSFLDFQSLDSQLRHSLFDGPQGDEWGATLTRGAFLTDVIQGPEAAAAIAHRLGADEILNFAAIDGEAYIPILGYDILDGELGYSLLTNFGSDIGIVNEHLESNGLVVDISVAQQIHEWFLTEMFDDPHVTGSRIFAVLPPTKIKE